jgi:hypothetical protein
MFLSSVEFIARFPHPDQVTMPCCQSHTVFYEACFHVFHCNVKHKSTKEYPCNKYSYRTVEYRKTQVCDVCAGRGRSDFSDGPPPQWELPPRALLDPRFRPEFPAYIPEDPDDSLNVWSFWEREEMTSRVPRRKVWLLNLRQWLERSRLLQGLR